MCNCLSVSYVWEWTEHHPLLMRGYLCNQTTHWEPLYHNHSHSHTLAFILMIHYPPVKVIYLFFFSGPSLMLPLMGLSYSVVVSDCFSPSLLFLFSSLPTLSPSHSLPFPSMPFPRFPFPSYSLPFLSCFVSYLFFRFIFFSFCLFSFGLFFRLISFLLVWSRLFSSSLLSPPVYSLPFPSLLFPSHFHLSRLLTSVSSRSSVLSFQLVLSLLFFPIPFPVLLPSSA